MGKALLVNQRTRDVLLEEQAELLVSFDYGHLPPPLQAISKPFRDLAYTMTNCVGEPTYDSNAGLRKILEAKDCLVRTMVRRL